MSLGYIWFNLKDSTYFPTLRVGQLGQWLFDAFNEDTRLTTLLEDLNRETSETIILAIQVGSNMQFLRVIGGTYPVAMNVREGFKAPLFTSAIGWALLSALTVPEVGSLVAAHNTRRSEKAERIVLDDLLAQLATVRKRGVAVAYEAVLPDTGAVAIGIRDILHDQPVAISVGGLATRMRQNEEAIVLALRRVLMRHRLIGQSTLALATEGAARSSVAARPSTPVA